MLLCLAFLLTPVKVGLATAQEDHLDQRLSAIGKSKDVTTASIQYLPFILDAVSWLPGTWEAFPVRPYAANSPWNTPIGPDPVYDPHSTEMVATLGLYNSGEIASNTEDYSYTFYVANEKTPRSDVTCTNGNCNIITPDGTVRVPVLKDVPIPEGAAPAGGSDAPMIVIDKVNSLEYDLRKAEHLPTGWQVDNGAVYNILWDGAPVKFGSRGAGVPYFAGLIRPWEIAQGHIDHAVAFSYPGPAVNRCVFPASKTDGDSTLPYAIPEGARLQLDPSLTEADFAAMGLSQTGIIIARALQNYGMILVNVSGRPKIFAENLIDNPYAGVQWSDPDLDLTSKAIANIPYTAYRVVALPAAYWTGENPLFHGECMNYQK
jgi:hypothetical protein